MRILITIALLVCAAGCGHPDFNEKYPKITNGMTKDEVVKIMGSPGTELAAESVPISRIEDKDGVRFERVITGNQFLQWTPVGPPIDKIIVGFEDDKVVSKWQWRPAP